MIIRFYTPKLTLKNQIPDISPLSVIVTNSSDTVPECQLVLTDDYAALIELYGFFTIESERKLYQITSIETEYDAITKHTVTGQEFGAVTFDRRIARYDYMDTGNKKVEEWISSIWTVDYTQLRDAFLYPPLNIIRDANNIGVLFTPPSSPLYTTTSVWTKGDSLFDYVQKEVTAHSCFVVWSSWIESERVHVSFELKATAAIAPIYYPDTTIDTITTKTSEPEASDYDYTITLKAHDSKSSNTSDTTINARITTNFSGVTSQVGFFLQPASCRQQDAGVADLSGMTWDSLGRYLGETYDNPYGKVTIERATTSAGMYAYAYGNEYATVRFPGAAYDNVPGLFLACGSVEAAQAVESWYNVKKAGPDYYYWYGIRKNGQKGGNEQYICCSQTAGRAGAPYYLDRSHTVNGHAYYSCYHIYCCKSDTDPTPAVTSYMPPILIGDIYTQNAEGEAVYSFDNDMSLLGPAVMVAYEHKLAEKLPKVRYLPSGLRISQPARTIDVAFAETADYNLGNKLTLVTPTATFSGIVTSVITTWEAGQKTKDIEVSDWEEVINE